MLKKSIDTSNGSGKSGVLSGSLDIYTACCWHNDSLKFLVAGNVMGGWYIT